MKNIKKLLAVAVAVAAAQSASANWDTGVDTSGDSFAGGNGELFLTLWDPISKTSYSQDTGIRFNDLLSGSAFSNLTIALDSTKLGVFGGDYSKVQWNLVAASGHYTNDTYDAYDTAQFGLIASGKANSLPGITDGQSQIDYVLGFLPKLNGYKASIGATSPVVANEVITEVNGGPKYAGGSIWAAEFSAYLPGTMAVNGVNGDTTNLWLFGFGDNDGALPLTAILGTATLNLSGGNGQLVLNASAPAVPLPAAGWFLASGLAGLGGIARSRKKKAAE